MARLARVGRQQKPTIALWGTADTDVPFALHTTLLEHIPHCTLHMFEDESHMFFQKAELVPKIVAIIACPWPIGLAPRFSISEGASLFFFGDFRFFSSQTLP